MTSPVKTIRLDKPLGEAVDEMLKHNLKRMPVVDSEGRLTGILARFDIFRSITAESPNWNAIESRKVKIDNVRFVKDIMRRDTETVSTDTPVEDIIRIIDKNSIQRVAVVDKTDRFVGMISDHDLLGAFAEHRSGIWDYVMAKMPFQELARKHSELIRQTRMQTASDVMKTDIVTVKEDTRIDEAVQIMSARGIKRLPVIDGKGVFKGMVSRDAVLRAGIIQS